MIQAIIICLILWFLPILTLLCIYYIDRYRDETLNQYIVRNNIEVFAFMSFIPCLGMSCMLILILCFVINRKYD
jgi:hypothetical protein